MRSVQTIRRDLLRIALRAAAALFIIPAIVWMFTAHVLSEQDAAFVQATEEQAASAIESQELALEAFRDSPPSSVCSASGDERIDTFRAQYCKPFSAQWQLVWANRAARLTTVAGALLLLATAGLGLLAFRNRASQFKSIVIGWRVLVSGSIAEILMQSVMLVWLAYWMPAYYLNRVALQLVIVIGIVVGVGAVYAVREIFRKLDLPQHVEGELVTSDDAPGLWARIHELAAKVGTAPPRHLVAGIDTNFFVTESELHLADRRLRGRSLFVSLPLLRVLDTEEADAVLAHELAHLQGGDAASMAAIWPKLAQFDHYLTSMSQLGPQLIAYYLLLQYRFILELALQKESREREFVADLVAARHVNPAAVSRSLIKVSGYSAYRARVEHDLFARHQRFDGAIGIAAAVSEGLAPFAQSGDVVAEVTQARTPHPFDTHPSLAERMGSLGAVIDEAHYADVLLARSDNAWIEAMPGAPHIEQRLWAAYEDQFRHAHEMDLAWRYLPATEEEREVVERCFPPRTIDLKGGQTLVLTYESLSMPAHGKTFRWADIKTIGYEEGGLAGNDSLAITLNDKAASGSKAVKMNLQSAGKQRDLVRSLLGQYWNRHTVSHAQAQG